MARLLMVGLSGVACGLFAADSTTSIPTSPWGELSALACVIGVLLFIVTKILPDLHQKSVDQSKQATECQVEQSKVFAEAIETTQTKFADTLDKIHERGTQAAILNAEELAKLREHCAEMHGKVEAGQRA
jgi:hypothetical protein